MVSKKTLGFKKKDKKPANENDAAVREERLKLLKKAKEEYLAKHDNKKIQFRRINKQDMVETIKKNKEQYLLNYTKNKISIKEGNGYPAVWEDGFDQYFPRPVGVIDTTAVPSTSGTNVGAGDQTAQAAGTSDATDATDATAANAGPAAEVVTPTVDPAADATAANAEATTEVVTPTVEPVADATAANAGPAAEVVTPTVEPAADATTAATDATTTTTDGNVPPVVGASTESDAHQPPIAATTTATTPVQIEQPTPTVQQPPVAQPTETTPINPQQQPHDVTTTSSGTDTGTTSSQHHDTTDDQWAGIGWRANYDPTKEPELDLADPDDPRWQGLDTQRPVGGGSLSFADSQDMNADLQPHTIQHPAKPMSDINVQTQPNQLIRFLSKSGITLFTGGFVLAILITMQVAVLMYSGRDITKHLTGQGI